MCNMAGLRWISVFVVVSICSVYADWESDPEWSFRAYLDEDTTLTCNDTMSLLMAADELWWHLPDQSKIHGNSNTNTSKHQLMDDNGVRGGMLKVKNVQSSDSGLYVCMVYRNDAMYRKVNRGLNLHGHLVKDNFDLYRNNVLVAFVAAIVFLVPMLVICFLYHYRYRTTEEVMAQKADDDYFKELHRALKSGTEYPQKPTKHGYSNSAYENTQL